ncbi:MAG: alkaline phosphatase family protein [Vicinamibacterales bacterium]|nr:alkaline phosphatase family protein [Vicinamibacterales bacterium]
MARLVVALLALTLVAVGCGEGAGGKKVIVLGIDGMDHGMLEAFIADGRLPNFARLADQGSFSPLETTMPPLSPVAWSTFITGMDPGGHGVFDFLLRDPATMDVVEPFYAIGPEGRSLELGSWVVPLSGGDVELFRRGQAFWELLDDAGIDTTIFRMPVNFPPVDGGRSFAGMGTPDILGLHGIYSFYTDFPPDDPDAMTGRLELVEVINGRVEAQLFGPPNALRRLPANGGAVGASGEPEYENPDLEVDFEVLVDPDAPVAKIVVQDTELVLNEGEWSDWVRVDFEALPYLVNVSAMGRFYLQEVRPDFKLYVSPLQIHPDDPAMPLSSPEDWSADLHDVLGPFYTQELPEETKAFSEGIFSGREFWEQSQFVYGERRRALDHFLDTFEEGLLFFYFSSVDQGSHMLYHYADPEHPLYEPDDLLQNGIATLYEEMDEALGRVLEAVDEDDDTTLIVMSDHGFSPFYWGVNLNTWLLEQGYVTLTNPSRRTGLPMFTNVDWSRTRAYAFGMGGVFVNLQGREPNGIVTPGAEYDQLLEELQQGLLAMVDERNGNSPIASVLETRDEFVGTHLELAPDLLIGYDRGYRYSWESPLGEFSDAVIVDNDDPWSGDHTNDHRLVPGVLLTNQRISLETPALQDLTVAVLDEFGVAPLPEMIGEDTIEAR